MIDFQDRVALVTGAGRGLGASHARLLASRGAAVVVNDPGVATDGTASEARPADEVVAEVKEAGGAAIADYGSVSNPDDAEAMVQRAIDEFGRIDIVVNNAGILRDKAFHNLEWPNLEAVLDVHLKGAFFVTQPAFRHMREQSYGRIVMTSSNSGLLGNFGQANYGAAKMGLVGLSNVLAIEGAKYGISSNVIAPVARTRMTEDLLGPLAEYVSPEQVTPMVVYLCSEENPYTHEIFSAGGGRYARFIIGVNDGWFAGTGTVPSVEQVAQHMDEIRDMARHEVFPASAGELEVLGRMLSGDTG